MEPRVLCPQCLADNDDAARCRKCGASLNLATLDVVKPEGSATRLLLRPRRYALGRGAEADLLLPDKSVSRVHAHVEYRRGDFYIEDNASRHGVYLDAARIRDARLTSGCTVQIGSVLLRFRLLHSDASTSDSIEARPKSPSSSRGIRKMPSDWANEALDRLQLGVILVSGGSKVAGANRCARMIADEQDGLLIERGELRTTDPAATRALRDLFSGEAADGSKAGGLVAVARRQKRPLTLLVTPLTGTARGAGQRGGHAVFVSDPDREIGTTQETLQRLHGLTPAEAALAVELLQGRTLESSAAELGIAVQTARTYLKKVFAKTRTRRQSELVLLLLKGVPPV